jgi:arylsulfatase A-like enzyme
VGFDTALIGKTHFSPTPTTIDHLDAHTGNNDKRSQTTAAEDFLETYLVRSMNLADSPFPPHRTLDDTGLCAQVDETMKWLDARTPGTPWYVYTSMVSPHPPNWVPIGEPWTSAYAGKWRHWTTVYDNHRRVLLAWSIACKAQVLKWVVRRGHAAADQLSR